MEYKESLVKFLTKDKPDMNNRTLVAWGMGNTAQLYYEGLNRLESEGFVISFYTSSTIDGVSKGEDTFNGKPVISPSDIRSLGNPLVLVMTPNRMYFDEIKKTCNEMGG